MSEILIGGGHRQCTRCGETIFGSVEHECKDDWKMRSMNKDEIKAFNDFLKGTDKMKFNKPKKLEFNDHEGHIPCDKCKELEKQNVLLQKKVDYAVREMLEIGLMRETEFQELEKENQDMESILKLWITNKPTPDEYTDIINKYFWELV